MRGVSPGMTTTPCLWFDTQGEDAARFYCSVFPNSRILNVTHYGPDTPRPEGTVMTVDFELDGQKFVALNGGPEFTFSEAISFMIDCKDQDEVDRYWTALGEGGEHGPVRLAQGPVRSLVAGHSGPDERAAGRPGSGAGEPGHAGDAEDGQAHRRRPREGRRRLTVRRWDSRRMPYDVAAVRSHFPALREGAAHFDGPGGTQTPDVVAEAVATTLTSAVANRGAVTAAERRADRIVHEARAAMGDLLGARTRRASCSDARRPS